jgi:ribosomal protein S18 acetylase RimI-like enzyme
LTSGELTVDDVPKAERARLFPILEESFEGLYLWHARRTLQSIDTVRRARTAEGDDAGLIMTKKLAEDAGYVYYVAVSPRFRRQGVGGRLLDDALSWFAKEGVKDVYASVEEDNAESMSLFASKGFLPVKSSEMASRYGRIRSFMMYREMMVVHGEILLGKELAARP